MTPAELARTLRSPARTLPDGTEVKATERVEIALALGPQVMGEPLDGSYQALHAVPWTLEWAKGDTLRLYQQQAGAWVEVQPGQALPPMTDTCRHISLAFDQSARHVLAWEDAGQIFIRQWDTGTQAYLYRGGYAGVDPVVVNDGHVMYEPSQSDICAYYLSPDRTRLCVRVQRDNFGTEYVVADGLVGGVLDQAVALPYRLQLLGESGGAEFAFVSDLYPVHTDALSMITAAMTLEAPGGGQFDVVVIERTLPMEAGTMTFGPLAGGERADLTITMTLPMHITQGTFESLTAGSLVPTVMTKDTAPVVNTSQATYESLTTGRIDVVVISVSQADTVLTAGYSGLLGGIWNG